MAGVSVEDDFVAENWEDECFDCVLTSNELMHFGSLKTTQKVHRDTENSAFLCDDNDDDDSENDDSANNDACPVSMSHNETQSADKTDEFCPSSDTDLQSDTAGRCSYVTDNKKVFVYNINFRVSHSQAMFAQEDCVRLMSVRRVPTWVTEPSVQLDLESGTICRRTSDSRTCYAAVSDSR